MAEGGLTRLPDWLVIAQESWDEVERRNQLLVRALAARHPHARFLFSEQPLRPRGVRAWRWPRPHRVAANIWSVRPIRVLPDSVAERLSDEIESAQIRRAVKSLGLHRPFLWTQDPRAAALVDRVPVDGVVYDLTDDWAAFETDPGRRALVQARIESLGRRAWLVLACSRPLERGARAWTDRVRYLPNAVDPPSEPAGVPDDLQRLPQPRLGYTGTLHSSRLDIELLARAAEVRPSWSFVLLGPDLLTPDDRSRLLDLPNVHHLGVRPHAQIRSYIEGFDVCLLPNLVTEFTRSLDPLKVYEYLAAGRPVIATPVGNPPELEGQIAIAATPDQLIDQAQRALDEDTPERAAQRQALVADATWEHRAEEIERVLGVGLPLRRTAEVSVVIVSFNTCDMLERCLRNLKAHADVPLQTIVVDNASTDGSVTLVREHFPEVELIELESNAGFARANNIAFGRCRGEYVLLLNSDAFLNAGALQELVAAAKRNPHAGAVGPRLLNPDGTLQRSAWPFPRAWRISLEALGLHRPLRRLGILEDLGTWRHDEERTVDFLIGACLLLRADALAEVSGFDEEFWLYGEEADLQRRMSARGWHTVLTPAATAAHIGAASSADSPTRLRHFYMGQKLFLTKHASRPAWWTARIALLLGSVLRGRWRVARIAIELGR